MKYIYETHLHTCEASACGIAHGADYIDYMISEGYSGIIVTDHFFNGNSCIPDNLPWNERIDLYCKGYENAKNAAKGKDFTVMFGVEFFFDGDEFLIYGIDKEWLENNEQIMQMSREELYHTVNKRGGLMIQAHPFRERGYLSDIYLTPSACDGIEVYNAANESYQNALARQYADEMGYKILTAGSDIHFISDNAKGGLAFEHPVNSISEFIDAVKNNEGIPVSVQNKQIFKVSELPEENKTDRKPYLPVHRL